ncbi:hypothetical protein CHINAEXTREME_04045 [Halobiforma lacisalsi AJ5]|uniref:Uncharacterized protein n=1 Tax=Natronobacterium lacisalsi AJ5 TaxID=358396 RepID=M0LMH4_NATLA|nr:hypothetical protein [Halobiforma lacisalsi]APW96992.1 hypothetical protein CHINAEXTREME_04045 [Halobiforma lacisalsi AJ5]EMA34706.1 hypothetical protein C445_07290 [Halobiforma lacisalsi AJ5]
MSRTRPDPATLAWTIVDAVAYAVAFAALVVAVVTPVAYVATRGEWAGVKVGLFLVGMAFFGYGSLRLWFASSQQQYDAEQERRQGSGGLAGAGSSSLSASETTLTIEQDSRLQTALDGRSWYPTDRLPPTGRVSPSAKLFLGSLLVLAASFAMETVFGV